MHYGRGRFHFADGNPCGSSVHFLSRNESDQLYRTESHAHRYLVASLSLQHRMNIAIYSLPTRHLLATYSHEHRYNIARPSLQHRMN